jgi:hypothetical protein
VFAQNVSSGQDDQLGIRLPAHPVNCSGHACPRGILVTSGRLGHHGDSAVGTANNGSRRYKRRRGPKIDDESYVFARTFPLNCRSSLHTEKRIALSVWHSGGSRSCIGSPLHVDGARTGSRATGVGCVAQLCGLGLGASVLTAFRLSRCIAGQDSDWQKQQGTFHGRISIDEHSSPHKIGSRSASQVAAGDLQQVVLFARQQTLQPLR